VAPGTFEPIDFFLFERRRGHCEYFSSAMTVLLRAAGVPARNVNGFLGGEWNEYAGYLAVRAGDAHSSVEVLVGNTQCVMLDPSPAASGQAAAAAESDGIRDRLRRLLDSARFKWFQWVIDYDLARQLSALRSLRDLFGNRSGRGGSGQSAIGAWVSDNKGKT